MWMYISTYKMNEKVHKYTYDKWKYNINVWSYDPYVNL